MNDNNKLLSPSAGEFILLLLDELYDLALWIAQFSPTRFLANMLGHGFDPDGSRLPEWNIVQDTPKTAVVEEIDIRSGGFAVGYGKDGLIYSEPATRAQIRAEQEAAKDTEITPDELDVMQRYNPPLLNIALARKIKRYWLDGRSDREAAVLCECSESYARHYRLAFERAARRSS